LSLVKRPPKGLHAALIRPHSVAKIRRFWATACLKGTPKENRAYPFCSCVFRWTMVAPQPDGPLSRLKWRTMGLSSRNLCTVLLKAPFPFPWIILTSRIPFSRHALRYSSTTDVTSSGENIWRSRDPSMGMDTSSMTTTRLRSGSFPGSPRPRNSPAVPAPDLGGPPRSQLLPRVPVHPEALNNHVF